MQGEGNSKNRILVVDDDPALLKLIGMRLVGAGYEVFAATSAKEALNRIDAHQPHVVITDLRMEGMDGMALFAAARRHYPGLPVVILTAHGTIPDAVEATKQGVYSYLTKPFDSQQLLDTVAEAVRLRSAISLKISDGNMDWRSAILGKSPRIEEVLAQAKQVAASDVSVLIRGASGTGKELLAKAIHLASHRAHLPFVAVNCAAIPESLFESELFGHVKGAYTGAERDHVGLFKQADNGTLFIDEVGETSLAVQVKLLRVLQDRKIRPVGASKYSNVDVRIICATNKDLEHAIRTHEFRQDLFYRLNVVELCLPTLEQRREDIPLLVNRFLQQALARGEQNISGFSNEAMELMIGASWPGNIRQLHNVVEQAVALCNTHIIPVELVQRALKGDAASSSLVVARDGFERRYLTDLLRATSGNVTRAAKIAGRNRTEFYKLLEKHHLAPDAFREAGA